MCRLMFAASFGKILAVQKSFFIQRTLAVVCCLLLFGCIKPPKQPEQPILPSQEVLLQAARVQELLDSAAFVSNLAVDVEQNNGMTATADLDLIGRLQQAGQQLALDVKGDIQTKDAVEESKWNVDASIILLPEQETYIKLNALTDVEGLALVEAQMYKNMLGKWFLLPVSSIPTQGSGSSTSVTKDPRIIHAQVAMMRVTEDHGIVSWKNRPAYHYTVTIDPEKMDAFLIQAHPEIPVEDREQMLHDIASLDTLEGSVWIDAETFEVHTLEWTVVRNVTQPGGISFAAQLRIDVSQHNKAPEIAPPPEAIPFSSLSLIGEQTLVPGADKYHGLEEFDSLPKEQQDAVLKQLLQDGSLSN